MRETVQSQRLGKEGGVHVETWRAEAAAAGYRHRSVLRPGQEQQVADRAQRMPAAYRKSRQMIDELLESRAVLERSAARVAAAKSLIATGVKDADEVSLLTRAMRTHGVDQEGERTAIKWGFDPGLRFARLTTDKWLQREREAIDLIKTAAADKSPALSPDAIRTAIDEIEIEARLRGEKLDFTKGHGAKQRVVIEHLGEAGRTAIAVGVAGSGKSTLMKPLVRAWQTDGRDVYGVTLGWRQTAGLEDAGIGATYQQNRQHLVDAGINQDRTFALTPFLSRMESGRMTLDKDSVLVIDEISLIGTKDMLRLLRLQQQQGFQISGIGDDRQGQSILAGATVDLFRRALGADQVPELVSTTRQIRDQDKETSLLFRKGEAEQALRRMDAEGRLVIVPGGYDDTIRATVNLWLERRDANAGRDGYTLGISVPTNADGRAIGEEIRTRRRAMGEIGADLVEIDATDQQGEKYSLRLAAGDRVRLFDRVYGLDTNGRNGLVGNNGSVVEVVGADAERLTVRKASGQVATILWDDLREDAYDRRQRRQKGLPPPNANTRVRLSRGDAVTISARQSETVTEHITAMPAGSEPVNGFAAYVTESRHRERSWIVVSHDAEKTEVQQRRAVGDPRNNIRDPQRIRDDIIVNMGRNLSRQPTKTLAQAFMERAKDLKSGTVERVQKAWFWREAKIAPPRPAPSPPAATPTAKANPAAETSKPRPDLQGASHIDDWLLGRAEPDLIRLADYANAPGSYLSSSDIHEKLVRDLERAIRERESRDAGETGLTPQQRDLHGLPEKAPLPEYLRQMSVDDLKRRLEKVKRDWWTLDAEASYRADVAETKAAQTTPTTERTMSETADDARATKDQAKIERQELRDRILDTIDTSRTAEQIIQHEQDVARQQNNQTL
ncbi:MAG: AAA family ATPase [Rhodopila sp.]